MGRHEIRLQRKKMTSRRIQSHKNYNDLLQRNKRSHLGKKVLKIVIYIIIILGVVSLAYYGISLNR